LLEKISSFTSAIIGKIFESLPKRNSAVCKSGNLLKMEPRTLFPWITSWSDRSIVNLATLGPVGRMRKAPGTWGSAAGLLWAVAFFWPLGPFGYVLLLVGSVYFATAICDEAEKRLGLRDPGMIVLDEFVALPVCFMGLPGLLSPAWMPWFLIGGFLVFRFFDIVKPLGINRLQKLPGGLGVVADDLAAALATCLVLHAAFWVLYLN
jgi:phosphatidylglycerophosphatase A